MTTDNVCVQAVLNAITDITESTSSNDGEGSANDDGANWRVNFDNRELIAEVHACVEKVNDRQKAVSCAHWFVRQLPAGADKVLAAQLCSRLAAEWHEATGSDEAEQAMNMAMSEYQRLTAIGIMRKYGIYSQHFSEVLHHKGLTELIEAFYKDKSIVERWAPIRKNNKDV